MRILIAIVFSLFCTLLHAQIEVFEKFDNFEKAYLTPTDNDEIYVINFWATWCIPCVKELPYFEALNEKYSDQNVHVVLVSLDFTKETVSKYVTKKGIKSKVVLLTDSKTNSWIDKVNPTWSGAIPATLFMYGNQKKFYEKDYSDLKSLEKDLTLIKTTKP